MDDLRVCVTGPFQVTEQADGKYSIYTDRDASSMADELLVNWDIEDYDEAGRMAGQSHLFMKREAAINILKAVLFNKSDGLTPTEHAEVNISEPRAYTKDEVRDIFLKHIVGLINYWDQVAQKSSRERLRGLAFSILVALDGEASVPGFKVVPCPHERDKDYHIQNGENWFPDDIDIAGALHDNLFRVDDGNRNP